ncbi:MAG: tRNA (N(6)-L-threonylcarbamoyladenosine(37)-C(2))-methylthiotransferase MtaB [Thermodesulfovibrionales bacterium]|nr:tRNA (N(6)-L-threonylcarbamoyladenosine(37)-C(2))-methylthiotransferase MtaB [Thermodesulfovibrionales bacterium]
MRFSILTLGCKTNQAESETLSMELLKKGHKEVELSDNPDICIINTCTVTAKSDYQSRQLIRRAIKTGARVIVTGCYVNRAKEELRALSNTCLLIKNEEKSFIINMFQDIISSNTINLTVHRSRPVIKIQDGCNKRCSFCIIPKVRGRSRSRTFDEVIEEIMTLEELGFNEVVLTGINIGSYGHDLKPKRRLEDLVEEIILKTKNVRIRISSLGIKDISARIIDLLKDSGRICRHLHLSLQSGDDAILRLMNRNYSRKDFIELTKYLKESISDVNIGADVIVGFPGEEEKNFENTYNAIKEAGIGYIHIFPYSRRPGTPAAYMQGQIDGTTKISRVRLLKELDQELRHSFYLTQVNKTHKIIIEDMKNGFIKGKTDNYIDVFIPEGGLKVKKSEILDIIIKEVRQNMILGKPLLSL